MTTSVSFTTFKNSDGSVNGTLEVYDCDPEKFKTVVKMITDFMNDEMVADAVKKSKTLSSLTREEIESWNEPDHIRMVKRMRENYSCGLREAVDKLVEVGIRKRSY